MTINVSLIMTLFHPIVILNGGKKVLWEKLEDFRQMGHLDMNSRTGSLLIVYDPEKAAASEALRPYIRYAASHARRNGFTAG